VNLRVVFMGSPEFAVPTLRELFAEFDVIGVVTQPDKPKGRGRKVLPTPVKMQALSVGLPVAELDNPSSPEFMGILRGWRPDVIVVAAYGKILPESVLALPVMGCVNLHASLLPRHRGASPISSSILQGDKVTGVCTILMDKGMDTGDILLKEEIRIRPDDTAGTLHDRLLKPGAELVVRTLKEMMNNKIKPVRQDHSAATYTKPLSKADGQVDWNLDSEYLGRLIRAMNPWPGAFCSLREETVKIWEAEPEEGQAVPGRVQAIRTDGVVVGTGHGLLRLGMVQTPAKTKITGAEFARGRRLNTSDIFD